MATVDTVHRWLHMTQVEAGDGMAAVVAAVSTLGLLVARAACHRSADCTARGHRRHTAPLAPHALTKGEAGDGGEAMVVSVEVSVAVSVAVVRAA